MTMLRVGKSLPPVMYEHTTLPTTLGGSVLSGVRDLDVMIQDCRQHKLSEYSFYGPQT